MQLDCREAPRPTSTFFRSLLGNAVSAVDAPYLQQVYKTAARMGAGLMVGRTLPDAGEDAVDRRLAESLSQIS